MKFFCRGFRLAPLAICVSLRLCAQEPTWWQTKWRSNMAANKIATQYGGKQDGDPTWRQTT
jgi:hypothetical protein